MSQLNDYIQYLSKKPFWPWEKEDVEGKLIRLELIVEEGNRHIVNSLTPFLFHSDTRLRHKVANAVFQLVGPMDTVRRYSDMYLNVAANPAMLTYFQEKFDSGTYEKLLCLASMDSNGFVRQKAVEILSQYPGQEGLRYILIRLADWVPQVRAAAENAIATLLVPERIKQWMAVIDSITWLQNVKRTDLSTAYNVITSFIAAQINLDEPYSNPPVYPESRWVTLFKWVLKHRNITWEQVRNWLWINDPRFYMDLLKNLGRFNSNEQMNLILFCLDQPDKRVRQTAMTYGRDFFAELEEWYWKGLCDNNAYIRLYCRDVLKDKIPDACGYYRKLVKEGWQLPGSLRGLIELGNDKELPLYKELLSHPNQKVRATALFGVAKFDYDAAIIPARSSLFDLNGTMRKAAVSVFLKNTDLLSFRELYQTFHENAIENRRTMLQMATRKSGWIAIPFLLQCIRDKDEQLQQLAWASLSDWRSQNITLQNPPDWLRNDILNYMKGINANELSEKRQNVFEFLNFVIGEK